MKKQLLSICGLIIFSISALKAQQVSLYSFTQFSDTYVAITGGTVFGNTTSDDQRFVDPTIPLGGTTLTGPGIPIGFNFTYNGNVFDRIAINNNGWISFGQSTLTPNPVNINSSSSYNALSATSTAPALLSNRIAGLARDLQGQTGSEIRVETIGATPNQTCVVQWTNYRRFGGTGDAFNFQIRLSETTNVINVIYGTFTTTTAGTAQVGLRGTANTDFNNRDVATTGNWATSIAGAANSAVVNFNGTLVPASGQNYQWTPPPVCSGSPNSGVASISSATGCPNAAFILNATGLTSALGITLQWYSSPSPTGPWSAITNATMVPYSTSTTTTTYYQVVSTCSVSALSATSSVVSYSIVNPGPCVCATYPGSSATSNADEDILNVTFSTLNNTSSCASVGPGAGSIQNRYSNYTGFLAAPTVTQGQTVSFTVQVGTCGGNFNNCTAIYIDYDQNNNFDPGEQAYLSAAATSGPHFETGTINIPITALVGTARMRVIVVETSSPAAITPSTTYSWGETEDYCIDVALSTLCSGTPNSGTSSISTPTGCPNTNYTVTATGLSSTSGISFQWYSSPSASGPWSAIPNATNTSYASSTTTTTYYQLVSTCSVSALTASTSVSSFSIVNPGPCVCGGYPSAGATSTADEEILNVTFDALNNTSSCTSVGPGIGSIQNRYSNYTGFLAAPTVTQGQTVTFTMQIGTCGGNFNNMTAIYIDYNQNGSFLDAGEQAYISAAATNGPHFETGSVTIPMTATPGTTRMRFVNVETSSAANVNPATYTWGETEDYCVDIAVAPLCSGAPASGTAAIDTPTGCPSVTFNINVTGQSVGLGIQYQWYSSPSPSGPWSAIPNATNTSYASSTTTTTYYQMETTCTVSAMTNTSSVVSYSIVNPGPCVCAGYPGSSANFTGDEEILGVEFGTLSNNSTCTTLGPGPGSIQNRYSNYSGFVSAPTVFQGQSVSFTVNVGTCGGNYDSGISIFIDYNQNGVFTDAGEQAFLSAASINGPYITTGNITIPLTASLGTTRMRVVNMETTTMSSILSSGTYGYGETEDYCIDIQVPPACTGAPNSGTAAISTATGCIADPFTVVANGTSFGTGISYQWYSAPSASGPWSSVSNATATTYSSTSSSVIFFQMVTTCSNSAMSATTSIVSYTPFQCYTMSNTTITSCTGTLYDSGGPVNMYQNNEDYTLTIVPSAANSSVMISFVTFSLENTYDYLYIYDGPTTADPLIGSYTGNTLPPSAMATNSAGILTLQMTSDFVVTQAGFEAALSCSNSCMGPPSAPASNGSVICSGNSTTLTTVATGTAMWYSSPSPSSPIATGSVYVTPILTSNTTYYVSDSTICGNSSLTPVTITVTPLPSVLSVNSTSICSGNSATVSAIVTSTAQWFATSTPTAPLSTNTLYTTPILNNTTTYYVRDTSSCGTSSMTPVTITVAPTPTVVIAASPSTVICAGQSVLLTASGANSYTWNTNAVSPAINPTPLTSTIYSVSATSTTCPGTFTANVSINVNPLPVVTLSASGITTICATNGSIGLQGSPSGGIYSGTAVTGTLLSIANPGTFVPVYSYTSSATGCSNTATVQVIVINCGSPQSLASQVVVSPQLRVYPNPNFGTFTIETGNYLKKTVDLVDIAGRVVKTVISTDDTIQMNISELSNGLYQMSIRSENGVDVIKLVKE